MNNQPSELSVEVNKLINELYDADAVVSIVARLAEEQQENESDRIMSMAKEKILGSINMLEDLLRSMTSKEAA